MEITMRPMTTDEAWQHILNNHAMYHRTLKNFGYNYDSFIPKVDFIRQMFEREILPPQYIKECKDRFINEVYDANKLNRLEPIFKTDVKPRFEKAIHEYLVPLLPSWNATMPKKLEILCGFGGGSGYWRKNKELAIMLFRVSRFPNDADRIFSIMFHEFVHMLIEQPIIQKYSVRQDLKERIVDLICYEFIKKPVQPSFEKSFANAYITPDVIKTNLPAAVQKMMADYNGLQQKTQERR